MTMNGYKYKSGDEFVHHEHKNMRLTILGQDGRDARECWYITEDECKQRRRVTQTEIEFDWLEE